MYLFNLNFVLFSVTYRWFIYETKLSLSARKMMKLLCLLFILLIRYPANKPIKGLGCRRNFTWKTAPNVYAPNKLYQSTIKVCNPYLNEIIVIEGIGLVRAFTARDLGNGPTPTKLSFFQMSCKLIYLELHMDSIYLF